MPYKYQGLGAGPTTRRMWVGIIAFVVAAVALYVLMIVILFIMGAI